MRKKLFAGPKVRALRDREGFSLQACAERLGVSISSLSQIESNQRPVTTRVLLALTSLFEAPADYFEMEDDQRLAADLRQALAESGASGPQMSLTEIKRAANSVPTLVRRFVALHRANERLNERLHFTDQAVSLDENVAASSLLPYEEVRDFFSDRDNYIHPLDTAAEGIAEDIDRQPGATGEAKLATYLERRLGIAVQYTATDDVMRRFSPDAGRLELNPSQQVTTRVFQLGYQIVATLLSDEIERELTTAGFRTRAAVDVCRVGLANYAAGALLMPYRRFAAAARESRHDLEHLSLLFQASLEQVCHRLSTLQRPDEGGLPFYFVRMDHAGNITKRHSATPFRFARFGGACPVWNIHEAISGPDRFLTQVAEMPDGARYVCLARAITKPSGSFSVPDRRYILGLGCDLRHAHNLVYFDGVNLSAPPARIGVSCRICERNDCAQRAFPPLDRPLVVTEGERRVVPFRLD